MLTLHDYLPSMNGWKARVLLGHLGIEYQSKPVAIFSGASRSEAFLQLNPAGAIPVLELGDGRAVAESNAILVFLATGTRALSALERALQSRSFLVENRLTIADIAVYAYGHRAEEGGFALNPYPRVSSWIKRVAEEIGPGYPVVPYGPEAQLSTP